LLSGSKTIMIRSLKGKYSCLRLTIIKATNSTWIAKKLLPPC
jgi:hypothetical protein